MFNIKGDLSSIGTITTQDGASLIQLALSKNSPDIVLYLASHSLYLGINLNEPDQEDFTLLMRCIILKRDFELARKLISVGADISKPNRAGMVLSQMVKNDQDASIFVEHFTSVAHNSL